MSALGLLEEEFSVTHRGSWDHLGSVQQLQAAREAASHWD